MLFMTWNLVNGIRPTLNSHISQYINGFDVIQIGGDNLFKVLSNDRSYAIFRLETRKLRRFTKNCREPSRLAIATATRVLRDPFSNKFFLILGFCAEYILGFFVRGFLCYKRTSWCLLFRHNLWNTFSL